MPQDFKGALIGPQFYGELKQTIARVNGTPYGGAATRIETRFEGDFGGGGEKNTINVKISSNWPTLSHTPLAVGQAIPIPLNRGTNTRLTPEIESEKLSGGKPNYVVSNESDLTAFGTGSTEIYVESNDTDTSLGSRCGIIQSVSDEVVDGYWECVVRVRGLVRCRVLLIQAGGCVVPPPSYPINTTLRSYWRRYPTSSEYGYATLVGIGARYRLNGANDFPSIAEAVVLLG